MRDLESKLIKLNGGGGGVIKQNDTTSNYELPSEFKAKWESFTMETILDAFGELFEDPTLLVVILNKTIQICQNSFRQQYDVTLLKVAEQLNCKGSTNELELALKPYLRENYIDIFCSEKEMLTTAVIQSSLKTKLSDTLLSEA